LCCSALCSFWGCFYSKNENFGLKEKKNFGGKMTYLILLVFCISCHILLSAQVELLAFTETDRKNDKAQTSDASAQETWTVYDRSNFEDSELCRVLNCRKRDYCLVKGEDAICLSRKKLRDAPGRKIFFGRQDGDADELIESASRHPVRQSVTKHRHRSQVSNSENEPSKISSSRSNNRNGNNNNNNAIEWDPDRVRQKLASYYRSMKRKERN